MIQNENNQKETGDNQIFVIDDIENIKNILSNQEREKLEHMFKSIDNFETIFDFIDENIIKKGLSENDLLSTYNIIAKIRYNFENSKKVEKNSFIRSFFELPEILSKKIRTIL